jgi:cellulose synthase/poly-beta-1,6-N-acetylglucosamine synthase-like glycosyltransferase
MLLAAFIAIKKQLNTVQSVELQDVFLSPFAKPVSLLVPAYNEASNIVESVKSILQLQYPMYEVILINDGSSDDTLERLCEAFDLTISNIVIRKQLPSMEIKAIYESAMHPNLFVVDKENGGKADAMNAGVNVSKYPLICSMDADSILEPDVLLKIVRPFVEDKTTVAAGGTIRIANGCEITNGRITKVGLPKNLLVKFQVIEYLRAFLAGRMAFSILNSLIIISGAFGIFRKDKVIEIGGYKKNTVADDMELVVRLHARLKEKNEPYSIKFIPDPVCWTEAPSNLKNLGIQRERWQRGMLESLLHNKEILFNRKYGIVGLIVYPFFFIVEGFGPFIEIFGVTIFAICMYFGLVDQNLIILFLLATFALNILLSTGSVIFEEMTFRRYPGTYDAIILVGLSFIEVFLYRPFTFWMRLLGTFYYITGKKTGWGAIDRKGF